MSFKKITCAVCVAFSINCGVCGDDKEEQISFINEKELPKPLIFLNTSLSTLGDKDENSSPLTFTASNDQPIENKIEISEDKSISSSLTQGKELEADPDTQKENSSQQNVAHDDSNNEKQSKKEFIILPLQSASGSQMSELAEDRDNLLDGNNSNQINNELDESLIEELKEKFGINKIKTDSTQMDKSSKDCPLSTFHDLKETEEKIKRGIPLPLKELYLKGSNINYTPFSFKSLKQLFETLEEFKTKVTSESFKEIQCYNESNDAPQRENIIPNKFTEEWFPFTHDEPAYWCINTNNGEITNLSFEISSSAIIRYESYTFKSINFWLRGYVLK